MRIVARVLEVITEPRTKGEIVSLTGLTENQIRDAINELTRSGTPAQKIGHGDTRHYYLPKYHQPRAKFAYEYVLDLVADTGEWWSLDEISEILNRDRHAIHCSIKRLKDLGMAKVKAYGRGSERAFKIERVNK